MGLDVSPDMLAEAQRKADERGVEVEWVQGDMRALDMGRTFDLVFIAANSLLHLHEAEDLVDCFRSVRRHLAPGARLIFDVFNPSVRMLAQADGMRRRRSALSFVDPDRGTVHVDVAETYDAAAQVTRGRWYFSADSAPDFASPRWRSGASSPRSCRCCSRSAASGLLNASATGPVDHSPRMRRCSSTSA
jgi:SAM-dependent methyltransferase